MLTFGVRAQIPVFTEGFEGTSIPAGWTTIDADQDGYGWEHSSVQGDVPGYTGSGAVASYSYDNHTYNALTPDNWLITPAISLNGTSSLSFWFVVASSYPGDHYGVYVSTTSATDPTAFTLLYEMTPTSANGAWTQQTVDLTSYAGNSVYIAFRHFNCTDMLLIALDDITVSTMTTEPTLTATPSALDFGIVNPNDYSAVATVQVQPYNSTASIAATVGAPFEISTDSISFASTASLPAAGGTLYVRYAPTAEGTHQDSIVLTAGSLSCTVMLNGTCIDCSNITLPFSESFENVDGLSCWMFGSANSANSITLSTPASDGQYSLRFSSFSSATDYNQYAVTPELPVTPNKMVSFEYRSSSTSAELFSVGYSTTTPTLDAFIWGDTISCSNNTDWTQFMSTTIPGDAKYIAINYFSNYLYYLYVDNFLVQEIPACLPPTALTVGSVMSSTASLSWSANADSYTVYYKPAADTVWMSMPNVTDTTAVLANLLPNTTYQWRVASVCNDGSEQMSTASSFTTTCAPYPLPFTENFDATLANDQCWRGASALVSDIFGGAALTQGSITGWSYQNSENNGIAAGHYRANIYGQNCKYWLITPEIDLGSVTSPLLTFDVAFTKYSGTAIADGDITDDKFMLLISTDGGQTWNSTNSITYNLSSLASLTYLTQYVDLSSYAGDTIKIAFYAESTVSGGDNNLHLDNISIVESTGELCLPVNGLTANNITKNSATLNWVGSADSYNVYVLTGTDTTLVQNVTEETITLNGLTPATDYTYAVRAVCNSEESIIATVSFTTLISCSVPTGLAAVLTPGDGTVATLTWHEVGDATAWQICVNDDSTNLIDVIDTTYNFTNLTPEQAYTVKVRANCDVDDQSAWSAPFTFTPTNAYTITVNEGTTTNNVVPVYGLWVDDITQSQFVIPAASLAAMQYGTINKLTFYSSNADVSWGAAQFNVYLTETNETTVSAITDYNSMSQVYAGTLSISENKMEITLTNPYLYMGGNLMFGFLQTVSGTYSSCYWNGVTTTGASMGGYGTSITQRDFLPKTTIAYTPGTAPTCFPVTGLTASNVTANQVTLTWSGNAASYSIYEDGDFVANVTDTTYTVTGLAPAADYVFGVRAICSATDSSMISNVAASTECGLITTYPYVQDFSAAPACWMILDADGDGQSWILYQGAVQSASYNSVALTPDNWLISPQFAIPATGNYEVTWSATAQDQSWPAEHYGVLVSTTGYSDTTNFTMLQEWTLGTGVYNPVINLSDYAGQNIYIALRHFNCTDQFRLSIDDFTVREQAGANQVTINVGQNNPAYGTVSGAGIYNIGDNVTVSATPATGYTFSKWVDENNTLISNDNPYTFVAATNLTLNAIFLDAAGTTYTITVDVNDSTMGTATGGGTYVAGDQITLVATPNAGYNFVNWTQVSGFGTNVVGTDPSLTITVTSDKTFIANFELGSGPVEPCAVPTGLHTTDIQNESVTVAWDANSSVQSWNVQYRIANGTWSSATANTNSYTITGLTGNTDYEIQVQANCGGGNVSDWSASVPVHTTGVGIDSWLENSVTLFPNPAKEVVNVQCTMENVQSVEVFDVYGKLITTTNDIDNPTRINVSGLANGMYFVRVTTEEGVVTKSFVKK